jgi:UDP-N-acetylmuramate dehydrogenase
MMSCAIANSDDLSMKDVRMKDINISNNEPMSKHTSWRAGGVAKRYVQAKNLSALAAYIATLPEGENLLWLGLGSNTLVRDGGFDGTVIATQGVMSQLELIDHDVIDHAAIDRAVIKTGRVYVGAGVAGAKLARFCAKHNLSGAEFFAGIPGLVGGALAMNAGAFGSETWPLIVEVETINRKGEIQKRVASEFEYSYRHVSVPKDEWFVSATLELSMNSDAQQKNNTIDIKKLLAKRAATQPTGVASCGSVFRNPEGYYAAELIEACHLKGERVGGAVVSEKHANFIINDNNASAADIESLIQLIQEKVNQVHGVILQPEAEIVGDGLPGRKWPGKKWIGEER